MDLNNTFAKVKQASLELANMSEEKKNRVLENLLKLITKDYNIQFILGENEKDMALISSNDPKRDRVRLTHHRVADLANSIRTVIKLSSPSGRVLSSTVHPNGMSIKKVSVPFGVIGVIYEARPNVTLDVFILCLKSGNACLLKGGKESANSNEAIISLIHEALRMSNVNPDIVALLPNDRQSTTELMNAREYVDLIIPRGGSELIKYVRENSKVPIIETGAGICHTYFDFYGFEHYAMDIIKNAKLRRVSVCNALDCLLIHSGRINELPELLRPMFEERKTMTVFADERAYAALKGSYPHERVKHATEDSFGTEFLDYKMAIKTVDSLDEALEHIHKYTSHHSECIITENTAVAQRFVNEVDAACVYVNVPTSFTDGGQFGMGAEIGISTQKLHARGPMGLNELNTYKWVIEGKGQTRP